MQILAQGPHGGPPTTAPTSLSAIPTNTNVAISFTAPTNDGGLTITNYEYSFNNSTWTALSPADATSPITVSGLTQNTAYTVYLRAVNVAGSGPGSTGVSFTTAGVPTGTPTITAVNRTPTTASIVFTYPGGGGAQTGFEYYIQNGTNVWTAGGSTSPISVTGLTENTTYYAYVRAVNAYGAGPQSAASGFVTPLPPLPVNFFVLAGGGGGAGGYIQPGVALWTGGGGGAGGLRTSSGTNGGGAGLDSAISFSSGGTATVTVGGGGAAGGVGGAGGGGGNSVFSSITATGGAGANASSGGNAGSYGYAGRGASGAVGGSGGGIGGASVTLLATRYWGSTYSPGAGLADYATGIGRGGGGGNGGAYNVNGGENGMPGPSVNGSGSGGTNRAAGNPGAGNYGGGGGGGSFYDYAAYNGAAGGSGIVIITYPTTYGTLSAISGLAYSYSVSGSTRIYQFTSGSGTITFPTF
jgi:hypothetical protein